MSKLFNGTSIGIGIIGGSFCHVFGGFDVLIKSLLLLVILDYITGLLKGIVTKSLSSEVGFKGLIKKVFIFIVVATAVTLERLTNSVIPLREVVIMFFVCNEALSLLENSSEIIPIPKKLKDTLIQLRDKEEDE